MRKWKCVSVNNGNERSFTVGKIYETDNNGYGVIVDSGTKIEYISLLDEMKCYNGKLQFIEVKDFTKSDLQECDVVVFRNKERRVYFDDAFLSRYNADKLMEYYGDNLVRNDETNEYDVMKVYRNDELIFNRCELSLRDIKIKELQDKMDAIKREMEELK
jgi:hypothetical protein